MKRPRWTIAVGVVAVIFGILTLISGGAVLFGDAALRAAAGDVVSFVLWFNFLSGALYVLAGVGIGAGKNWGAQLAAVLAVAVTAIFVLFGWHVVSGGAYEMRTVGAMAIRSLFWIALAVSLWRHRQTRRQGNA